MSNDRRRLRLTASIELGQKVVQERPRISDPLYLAGEKSQGPIALSNEASRPGQRHFLPVTLRSSRIAFQQDAMYAMKRAAIQHRSGRDKKEWVR